MEKSAAKLTALSTNDGKPGPDSPLRAGSFEQRLIEAREKRQRALAGRELDAREILDADHKPWDKQAVSPRMTARPRAEGRAVTPLVLRQAAQPGKAEIAQPPKTPQAVVPVLAPLTPPAVAATEAIVPGTARQNHRLGRTMLGFALGLTVGAGVAWVVAQHSSAGLPHGPAVIATGQPPASSEPVIVPPAGQSHVGQSPAGQSPAGPSPVVQPAGPLPASPASASPQPANPQPVTAAAPRNVITEAPVVGAPQADSDAVPAMIEPGDAAIRQSLPAVLTTAGTGEALFHRIDTAPRPENVALLSAQLAVPMPDTTPRPAGIDATEPGLPAQGRVLVAPARLNDGMVSAVSLQPAPAPVAPPQPAAVPEIFVMLSAHGPATVPDDARAAISKAGYKISDFAVLPSTIRTPQVRYYSAADAETARRLGVALGVPVRDFTRYSPAPPPGHIELLLATASQQSAAAPSVKKKRVRKAAAPAEAPLQPMPDEVKIQILRDRILSQLP